MAADPGSDIPSASVTLAIVEAVPIVMHVPNERAMPSSISPHARSSMTPARFSFQYLQTSVPLASGCPHQLPRSIGPAGRKLPARSC